MSRFFMNLLIKWSSFNMKQGKISEKLLSDVIPALGPFNNYVDEIWPKFDPPPPRVDIMHYALASVQH